MYEHYIIQDIKYLVNPRIFIKILEL